MRKTREFFSIMTDQPRQWLGPIMPCFMLLQQTDYDPIVDIDVQQAKETLEQAIDFVDACRKLCL